MDNSTFAVLYRERHLMDKLVYIINGPNLNLLGMRQPEIYGSVTLQEIEKTCGDIGDQLGFNTLFMQSNHEGEIIDLIHDARGKADGVIINPGAFSHTSVAILDALNAYDGIVVEVHISNIHKREEFRHKSYVSLRAEAVICGFGVDGYQIALKHLGKAIR